MSGNDLILIAHLGTQLVGHLILENDHLIWRYANDWQENGFTISPHLMLSNDIPSVNVTRFIRNMFPEGHMLDELLQHFQISRSNTFALIHALGLDLSGAIIFTSPSDKRSKQSHFRVLTTSELAARLDKRPISNLVMWDGKPRLSVAGIQDKINVMVDKEGRIGFGEGALCSTHILKFEQSSQKYLVLNEYTTIRLAYLCGLNVANVSLQQYGNHMALLVERFDRKKITDNRIDRRHVIDGCQAMNLSPEYKYERNLGSRRDVANIREGASLPRLFAFANDCINPAKTKEQMLDWVLFNILFFNLDAHGKNISFFVGPRGITLAPFYDLVNVKLYPDLDHEMAMALGDEFDSGCVNSYQLADFAESCELPRAYVAKRLDRMIKKVIAVLPQEITILKAQLGYPEFFTRYEDIVITRCQHLVGECSQIKSIRL